MVPAPESDVYRAQVMYLNDINEAHKLANAGRGLTITSFLWFTGFTFMQNEMALSLMQNPSIWPQELHSVDAHAKTLLLVFTSGLVVTIGLGMGLYIVKVKQWALEQDTGVAPFASKVRVLCESVVLNFNIGLHLRSLLCMCTKVLNVCV